MAEMTQESRGVITFEDYEIGTLQDYDIDLGEVGAPDMAQATQDCDNSGIREGEKCGLTREVLDERAIVFSCKLTGCPQLNQQTDVICNPVARVTEQIAARMADINEHNAAIGRAVQGLVYP